MTARFHFYVDSLASHSAADEVETLVRATRGVKSCSVTLPDGRVDVSYDPSETNPAAIREWLTDAGFKTSEVPPARRSQSAAGFGDWLKRVVGVLLFLSCNHAAVAKPPLRSLGMRTRKEWMADRVANVQTPSGSTIRLNGIGDNYLTFQLFWLGTGYYEPITTRLMQHLLSTADTFIDVGANIGFFSLIVSEAHPNLHVVAFEPNPKNHAILSANARLNGFSNVVCEQIALSDTDGVGFLHIADSDMSASLRPDFSYSNAPAVEVRLARLDSYLLDREDKGRMVIKVDVEGAEAAFFAGAAATLAGRTPDLIVEVAVSDTAFPVEQLRALGYRFYSINDHGLVEQSVLHPMIRGDLFFLNYLLSTRPPEQIAAVSADLAEYARTLRLEETSKKVDSGQIARALRGSDQAAG